MKSNWTLTAATAVALLVSPVCTIQSQSLPKGVGPDKPAQKPGARSSVGPAARSSQSAEEQTRRFLNLPLDFEPNSGQAPKEYLYVAHGPSYALSISASCLALFLHRPAPDADDSAGHHADLETPGPVESSELRLNLVGATEGSQITGLDPQPGRSNYFIGNDPTKWRTAIPHFNRVKVAQAYPGIDLVLYGNRQQLEYDFAVAPGADPGRIRLQAEGAQSVTLDASGNAILKTAVGDVELKHPVAYQETAGVRHPVESAFQLVDGHVLAFEVQAYDHSRPLIIDPILEYAVSIGGANGMFGSYGLGVAADASGNAYFSGATCADDFPTSAGTFQGFPTTAPAVANNCFSSIVVKIDPTGSTLLYSDFIGGTAGSTSAAHLTIDSSGNAYVAGGTAASDFPTVSNIGPSGPPGCAAAKKGQLCPVGYVLKLDPTGTQLLFSSLLGGNYASGAFQVKLNPVSGDLDVLGETNSSNFEPAPTTLETVFAGGSCYNGVPCYNGFLLGLDPATGKLRYGTFIGEAGNDWTAGMAFDAGGNIYVTGSTQPPLSSTLGTVTHTYAPAGGATAAGTNLFVGKFNLSGTTLTPGYLTLIQGDADTGPAGIAVDASSNLYFVGASQAKHLAVTSNAYQATNKATGGLCFWEQTAIPFLPSPCGTAIVGKLDSTGSSFLTYLGGSTQEMGESIALDSSQHLWIGGVTSSSDFPFAVDKYSITGGFLAPFLAEMSNDGTQLLDATLIADSMGQVSDLVIDSKNNVYVTGTASQVPSTPGSYPPNPEVYAPAFVQKWSAGTPPSISVTPTSLNFGYVAQGSGSAAQTITVQNTGTTSMELGVQLVAQYLGETPSDFPESTTCGASLTAGASCTVTVSFAPGPPSQACVALPGCDVTSRTASIVVANNATQGTQNIGIGGSATVGPSFSFAPDPIVFPAQAAGTTSAELYAQAESAGDSFLTISSIALTGPNASDFTLQLTGVGGPNCMPGPVPPGSFCNLGITFSPPANATGTRSATLVFTDLAGDSPQSIPITASVPSANFLNISPLTLAPTFPVAIGTSTYSVLDLQNPSPTNSVQVTGLNIAGANMGDFAAAPENCGNNGALPMTIPANSTCYVKVTFTPAAGASGQRVATLTVQTTPAATGLPTVSLTGDAATNSQPGMSLFQVPNPSNFGALQVGETSNAQSALFNVTNNYPIPCAGSATTCGAPLVISNITIGLSDYAVVQTNGATTCTPFPATIPIGGNCTYALTFTPQQAGQRNSAVSIQSNDPQGTMTFPVYGTGLSLPLGEALQTVLDFGNNAIGVASPPLSTTLLNAGMTNLVVSGVTASTNFAISANTCTGTLAPKGTCSISATFTPPSAGNFTGTLTISDNDPIGPQQIVTMAGTGATGPQLRIMPPTVNFGNQQVNVASPAQVLTLTSTGDTALAFPANAIRTTQDFLVQSTTCGASLAPAASCTANLQFKPSVVTGISEYGTALIADSATGSPQPVYMQGLATLGVGLISAVSLVSSLNPSISGQTVTFTATVTGPSGNTTVPTGTVSFYVDFAFIGAGTLSASGLATYSTSALSVATHNIQAFYNGDSNFAGATSGYVIQIVNASTLPATTTTLVSSLNPSTSGQSVTFTATVTGPTGNTAIPNGSVTFLDGGTSIGTGTLNGIGQATFTTSSLSFASHSITATYGGSTTFAGSTSSILTQVVNTGTLPATTTALISSVNPSTSGQSVTFTATVAGPSGNTTIPSGTVTFLDGAASIGTGTSNGSGQATFTNSSLSIAAHSITASYGGSTTFAGSTSGILTQVVNKANSTTAVVSSVNPSASGQSVMLTATVTGPSGDAIVPTGTVNFLDGTTSLGSGTLNASGVGTFSTSTLSSGTHSITAVYAGDANFTGSTSVALSQVVNPPVKLTSTTSVTSSLNPSGQGQSVTFTGTVTGPTGNLVVPTGTLTFMDDTSTLGTGTLNASGVATYNTSSLTTGTHSITAVYGGDSTFAGSTSSALTQTVNAPGYTVTFSPTTLTVTGGSSGTTTITVTPTNGFNQQISFTCSGLPAFTTCSFSPANITPNGTSAATSTLTIATNVATASLTPSAPLNQPRSNRSSQAFLALILLGLGGLVRSRRAWKGWMLSLALIAVIGTIVAGCGGGRGGSGGGGSSTTPKGTSTITVTATSGNLSQPATFTLTVQ